MKTLAKRLLRGQEQVTTSTLLEHFEIEYREAAATDDPSLEARKPPTWAQPLLDTVSRQCAMRQRDSLSLFKSFDSDGDGFISLTEFQKAMLLLGGYDNRSTTPEQQARVNEMLLDLAHWVAV